MTHRTPRTPLENPVTPRDAATLILLREQDGAPLVLMGKRHRKHAFIPDAYVFPGGGLDLSDASVPAHGTLSDAEVSRMDVDGDHGKAQALALTALRETAEETGLVLGTPGVLPDTSQTRDPANGWSHYRAHGLMPDIAPVHYFGRAITGPWSPIRFHARFFIVALTPNQTLAGDLGGSGELLDLQWISVARAMAELPIVDVTEFMLGEILRTWPTPEAPAPRPLFTYFGDGPAPVYE